MWREGVGAASAQFDCTFDPTLWPCCRHRRLESCFFPVSLCNFVAMRGFGACNVGTPAVLRSEHAFATNHVKLCTLILFRTHYLTTSSSTRFSPAQSHHARSHPAPPAHAATSIGADNAAERLYSAFIALLLGWTTAGRFRIGAGAAAAHAAPAPPRWPLRALPATGRRCVRDMPRGVLKADLPSKVCEACGRPFTWRKVWERCWDEVFTCSDRCKSERKKKRQQERRQQRQGGEQEAEGGVQPEDGPQEDGHQERRQACEQRQPREARTLRPQRAPPAADAGQSAVGTIAKTAESAV
jgi:hypothetical protein